jgi:cytochrome c oxidase cbb3-type subunit 3
MIMSGPDKREIDDHSGQSTTGHEWDGIKELDNPLPRWWLNVFYATIFASIVFWVLMPAWPLANGYTHGLLHRSDRREVSSDISRLQAARQANYQRLMHSSYDQIVADPQLREFAFAAGQTTFGDRCRTCHGAGGAGASGYPNLADDVWIWGGALEDIEHTITVGVRSGQADARASQMPAFGRDQILPETDISDVTEYVLSLGPAAGREHPNAAAAPRGQAVFEAQCAVCHSSDGSGSRAIGAPSLRDDVWLYGGSRAEVRRQIELGRGGVMPSWRDRLDPAMIKALAVYVYGLGGGERAPPPSPTAPPSTAPPRQTLRAAPHLTPTLARPDAAPSTMRHRKTKEHSRRDGRASTWRTRTDRRGGRQFGGGARTL